MENSSFKSKAFSYLKRPVLPEDVTRSAELLSKDSTWEELSDLINSKSSSLPQTFYKIAEAIEILSQNYAQNKNYSGLTLIEDALKNVYMSYILMDYKLIGNWWEWRIGIPYLLSVSYLMLDDPTQSLVDYKHIINVYVRQFAEYGDLTYANQASICRNLFLAGIVLNDINYVSDAVTLSVPAYTPANPAKAWVANLLLKIGLFLHLKKMPVWLYRWKEGFYESDYSFIQHTSVPYVGTYGVELLEFLALLCECGYPIPEKIQRNITTLVKVFRLAIYDDQMMLMYCGRSINEVNTKEIALRIKSYIKIIGKTIDLSKAKWPSTFWIYQPNSARFIYQAPGWRLGIAMSSNTVPTHESFNGQNEFGENYGLGATYLYIKGDDNYVVNRTNPFKVPGTVERVCSGEESRQPFFRTKFSFFNKVSVDKSLKQPVTVNMRYKLKGVKYSKIWQINSKSISAITRCTHPVTCIIDDRYNADLNPEIANYVKDKNSNILYWSPGITCEGNTLQTKEDKETYYIIYPTGIKDV